MEDPDLIARVYPTLDEAHYRDGPAKRIIRLPHHSDRCVDPDRDRPKAPTTQPTTSRNSTARSTRESTESPEDASGTGADASALQLQSPYLEFRFSQGIHGRFIAGRNQRQCHFLLSDPSEKANRKVSNSHFALTYKKIKGFYRLVLRDLNSTLGTVVTYDDSDKESRRNFDWIVDGDKFLDGSGDNVLVHLNSCPPFKIVAARHDITSSTYIANVERFLEIPPVTDHFEMHLGGQDTEFQTGAQSPTQEPIRLTRELLGVTRCWDVSTAEETACKSPTNPLDYSEQGWDNDIAMMKKFRHPHIVRLLQAKMSPQPKIWLEYLPKGNLKKAHAEHPFTEEDCCLLVFQCADALEYLHREDTAHRDIKPENILIATRDPLKVKLGDFGLSKVGSLHTKCGTPDHVAPEVIDGQYTPAADIWSLGCVLARLLSCFPDWKKKKVGGRPRGPWPDADWYSLVVKSSRTQESTGLTDILRSMLIRDPEQRATATEIMKAAGRLIEGSARASTPTQASCAADTAAIAATDANAARNSPRKTARGPDLEPPGHRHKRIASDDLTPAPMPSEDSSTSRLSDNFWMDPINSFGGGSALQSMLRPDLGTDESDSSTQSSSQGDSHNKTLRAAVADDNAIPSQSKAPDVTAAHEDTRGEVRGEDQEPYHGRETHVSLTDSGFAAALQDYIKTDHGS
ncbi:kinase-like domain-containing protein [Apiospora arundinis]|uniref:Kinase-like domain-containing protein n=1 Tax=Apiospora arundinis TaxID=335852 RepID=A0ABR2IFJ9_9PEZI